MKPVSEIRDIFKQHDYIMRTAELRQSKIYYEDTKWLIENGVIEKIKQR